MRDSTLKVIVLGLSLLIFVLVLGCATGQLYGYRAIEAVTFPMPPPRASSSAEVPSKYLRTLGETTSLREVERRLVAALQERGYSDKSYYAVPKGFVLVTRIEQFEEDGASKRPPNRWLTDVEAERPNSFGEWLSGLFIPRRGFFRIIVFIVMSEPFGQSTRTVSRDEAELWVSSGLNRLAHTIGRLPFTDQYECTVLIYEFEQVGAGYATPKVPGRFTGQTHLDRSGLWKALVE